MGKQIRRVGAWVFYENPAHLVDDASYVKEDLNFVSSSFIKNSMSIEVMNLEPKPGVDSKINVIVVELIQIIKYSNLSIDKVSLGRICSHWQQNQWRIYHTSVGRYWRIVEFDED